MDFQTYYTPADGKHWSGRIDGAEEQHLRWHQVIKCIDLNTHTDLNGRFVLLGYACDEGVKRNGGRVGAAKAPNVLRTVLSNLPVFRKKDLVDAGDIQCIDQDLEASQEALGYAVSHILKNGGFPIVLGGGHEVTFGHYRGLRKVFDRKIGIINFDAHFDIRRPQDNRATSGTGFYQIAQLENELHYLPIGIQKISNTQALFDTVKEHNVQWITAQDFDPRNSDRVKQIIDSFIQDIDHLYVTVDMDVFAAAYAPGVSAVAYNGLVPNSYFLQVFEQILASPKLVSIDFAELNPDYDMDNRTAKLAADLVFRVVNK